MPIQLSAYNNAWYKPGGSMLKRAAWFFLGQPILRSAWIPSSSLRVALLRAFGARIGTGVVIKPSVDVKYPWHLRIGDHCWIGERCWIDNLTTVQLGSNVCVSQGAYFCTGNHNWSDPAFGLIIAPIHLGDGAWAGAMSILLPGTVLGEGAVAAAGSVVSGVIPSFEVYSGNPACFLKRRVVKESPFDRTRDAIRGDAMKILFLNQFFWPDSSATSQQLTDLATGLAERGNQVTVICSEGGYAAAATGTPPPVTILRVKSLPFVRGRVGRVLSYLSFYITAAFRGLTTTRPDVVVSLTTPPVISLLGTLIKALRGSRHFIWEQDIYPDVAIDLGYFKADGLPARLTGFFADLSRRHADGIIALGQCMKDRLIARGLNPARIQIAENWANGAAIEPMPRPGDPNQLVLLYSGNLGLAHDLDTLTGAIRNLRHDPRFRFIFVGSGGKRKELADFCTTNEIHSVELRPYVPRDQLNQGLAIGDIGLVTQHDVCCGSVVPSKVYGILAAGRPILFIGPRAATPALTIEQHRCGWHVDCGDQQGLTNLLLHLAANREEVFAAGRRARTALLEHYDLPLGVDRIAGILGAETESLHRGFAIAMPEPQSNARS